MLKEQYYAIDVSITNVIVKNTVNPIISNRLRSLNLLGNQIEP